MNNSPENVLITITPIHDALALASTIVPLGGVLIGEMEADSDIGIRIDGEYSGGIHLKQGGFIHVAKDAVVSKANFIADYIFVEGVVSGNLNARRGLEIAPSATVNGEMVYSDALSVHVGSRVSGILKNLLIAPIPISPTNLADSLGVAA